MNVHSNYAARGARPRQKTVADLIRLALADGPLNLRQLAERIPLYRVGQIQSALSRMMGHGGIASDRQKPATYFLPSAVPTKNGSGLIGRRYQPSEVKPLQDDLYSHMRLAMTTRK